MQDNVINAITNICTMCFWKARGGQKFCLDIGKIGEILQGRWYLSRCLEELILTCSVEKKRIMFLTDETNYSKGTKVHDSGMENSLVLLKKGWYAKYLTTSGHVYWPVRINNGLTYTRQLNINPETKSMNVLGTKRVAGKTSSVTD